jgi:hypothetical protein
MIIEIISVILIIIGLFYFIKLDNSLLPYIFFYYNPKKPLKPVAWKGGLGKKHIGKFGKSGVSCF